MNSVRITKVANPRKKRAKRKASSKRRKLSLAQIRAGFGGKRRRNAAKATKKRKAKRAKSNPRTRTVTKTKIKYITRKPRAAKKKKARRRSRPNPAFVMTLGPVNPGGSRRTKKAVRKGKKNYMAKKARRKNRKAYSRKGTRRVARRRNPSVFGHSSGMDLAKIGGGIVLGVSAAKLIPPMFDETLGANASSLPMKVIITGAVAFGAGMLAKKVIKDQVLGDAVIAGGLAQTVSMALNGLLPASLPYRNLVTLNGGRGVGDFVPTPNGRLTLPWNPVGTPSALAAAAVSSLAANRAGAAFAQ